MKNDEQVLGIISSSPCWWHAPHLSALTIWGQLIQDDT